MRFCLIFSLLLISCKDNDKHWIASKVWEYDKGIYRGDFFEFDNPERNCIKGDTIFKNKEAVLLIVSLDRRRNELHVKSLNSDSSGVYINIEEFTH